MPRWDLYDLDPHTYFPGWDLYDLDLSHMFTWVGSVRSAGSAISLRVIVMYQYLVYHAGRYHGRNSNRSCSIRDRRYDITVLGGCRSWDLGDCRSSSHAPHAHAAQLHKHTRGVKQSTSISMADIGGSSSSGSATADDLSSAQQGGSSADPGVETTEWLDDADEEAVSTVRCMLFFVFGFAHVLVFVCHALMPVPEA